VRDSTVTLLEDLGFSVLVAGDGVEALALLRGANALTSSSPSFSRKE
jgi:CheY-like chemotaxis protein